MKRNTRIVVSLLCAMVALACCSCGEREDPTPEKPILSELSDDDLLKFLDGKDLPLERLCTTQEETLKLVRSFIVEIEKNPNIMYVYNWPVLLDVSQGLKEIVNEYYGV